VKSAPPRLAGGAALRAREEVLERHMQKGTARLCEDLAFAAQGAIDMDSPPAALRHPRCDLELAVDEDRTAVADEDPRGDGRKAVPRGEKPAGLVQGGSDETAVDDSRTGLVALAEGEGRLVALDAFFDRAGKMDPLRVFAAPPTRRIVVRRYPVYRRPPRSKCAL
jgi:hypothetical protein